MLHAVKIDEALVYRIAEIGWYLLTDQAHDTASQFSIKFIVRGKHGNLMVRELLGQLEIRRSSFDTHRLCFIATGNYTTIVIAQYHDWLSF